MNHEAITETNYKALFESTPGNYLILKPNPPHFTIIGVSDFYLLATLTKRNEILGRGLFEVFPDNPDDTNATGTDNLRKSLECVISTKAPHKMAIQKYDIQRPLEQGGGFEERYWSPLNTPLLINNEVEQIIHAVVDVTELSVMKQQLSITEAKIQEKTLFIKNNEERINTILEILLKYTSMDFSQQITISNKCDELDAIAEGLNTLSEKIVSYMKQINESQRQYEIVNKELESFSYSVSHDLRAPLRAVNGYAQILEEDFGTQLDDEGKRLIGTIKYNAKKMGNLIDDLLTFSKLGRNEVKVSEIDMNKLTEEVLNDINKYIIHSAHIKVDNLHKVNSDHKLIYQVLFNLISNAIKYSSKREKACIEISSQQKQDEIIFSITDNGVGFDMKYYDKLFGVFQRLHSSDDFEGTGVGLAIVKRVIAKHGGSVWAEGILNEGATFYFSLPNKHQ